MSRVRAPQFPDNKIWLNTDRPLSLEALKGRVVILDFWTYCCINCLHVLPELKFLEHKYSDRLTVIGVHSAKFDNEKEVENIRQAILRYAIEHPVIVDSNFDIWSQYTVRAWPTLMVIDPEGYVIGYVQGEGNREALDEFISKLLAEHEAKGTVDRASLDLTRETQQHPLVSPLAFPGKVLAGQGRLFIADSAHHRLVVSNLEGEVEFIIGQGEAGFQDGSYEQAQFNSPQGMALNEAGDRLYVADTENHALRWVDLNSRQVKTLAGTGVQNRNVRPQAGESTEIALNSPWDLVLVGGDRLFIAMAGPHQIWELDLSACWMSTYAGTGAEACVDGALTESGFAQPSGITTDGEELFVADSEISSIRALNQERVRTVCGSGELFGFGDADGIGIEVRLQHCLGIEYARGYLWVADTYNHKIKRVDPKTGECQTIVGDRIAGWEDSANSRFYEPSGCSATASHLYIADTNNHAIRRLNLDNFAVETLKFPGLCAPNVCFPEDR